MQSKKLYVGNLKYSVTSEELNELFGQHGTIVQADVIEGKGFGFVEFETQEEADKAREALNGHDFQGRNMRVDYARPRKPRDRGWNDRGY